MDIKKIIPWVMSFSKALLQPYIMEKEADEFSVKFLWANFCQRCHPAEAAWAADSAGPHPAALHCQHCLSNHFKAVPKDSIWGVLIWVFLVQTSPSNVLFGAESSSCLHGHSSNVVIHNRDARKQ